jgi:hypothetical protein
LAFFENCKIALIFGLVFSCIKFDKLWTWLHLKWNWRQVCKSSQTHLVTLLTHKTRSMQLPTASVEDEFHVLRQKLKNVSRCSLDGAAQSCRHLCIFNECILHHISFKMNECSWWNAGKIDVNKAFVNKGKAIVTWKTFLRWERISRGKCGHTYFWLGIDFLSLSTRKLECCSLEKMDYFFLGIYILAGIIFYYKAGKTQPSSYVIAFYAEILLVWVIHAGAGGWYLSLKSQGVFQINYHV